MAKRVVVYAFLPLGSRPTAECHYIRIGHHASLHSDGTAARLNARFHGLNSVREVLLMVEVDSHEMARAEDHIRMKLQGPCTINTVSIKFHETFPVAYKMGHSWYETKLPLADVRAVFYELETTLGGPASRGVGACCPSGQSLGLRGTTVETTLPNAGGSVSGPTGFGI
jgi:hypothetical protein